MRFVLAVLLLFLPHIVFAYVSGIDDISPNISKDAQEKLDAAITTYYQQPTVQKVNTVLDTINTSELLRKKSSWAPLVGFLTVVFADNKDHVMSWMSRNDYNSYAEDVIISSLLHAKLKESALVFAQAHQWKREDVQRLIDNEDTLDLRHLDIILPGHIDTLWGAFFGSGDIVYVNQIINVLSMKKLPSSDTIVTPEHADVLGENKRLAASTLKEYATTHDEVRDAIKKRIIHEKDSTNKKLLTGLLPKVTTKE